MWSLDNFAVIPRAWRGLLLASISLALASCDDANSSARAAAATPPGIHADTVSPEAPPAVADALIFSAPPRESIEESMRIYRPVAEYLSRVLGKPITYQHSGNWGVYRTRMLAGDYDLVFDGPHFNGYRAEKLQHTVIVKADGAFELALFVRGDFAFASLPRMAGRTFCTLAPPNLGAMVLFDVFDNPARQPAIVSRDSYEAVYQGVADGHCAGGVMPVAQLEKFDRRGETRIVYKTPPLPNQAFSAGPRFSPGDREKIVAALLSSEGRDPLEKLRATYKISHFSTANNEQYQGLATYLRNEWGYY